MAYSLVSEALQLYVSAISLLVLYLRTSLYQRHNSIASVLFLGVWEISNLKIFISGIRLKLFLTSLLKPLEENLTVTILIKLKRVLLHGHIAKMKLM